VVRRFSVASFTVEAQMGRAERSFATFALASFAFATVSLEWRTGDGADLMRWFGMPFPWHAPGVNSLSWHVAPPALVIDFACFALISFAIVRGVERLRMKRGGRVFRVAAVLLFVCAMVQGAVFSLYFAFDTSFESRLALHGAAPPRPARLWFAPAFDMERYRHGD
jgi:hypothetical protein